ncbi:MAG: glycosyltransferase family 9 protein [Gammaproteobacteria bacterium]
MELFYKKGYDITISVGEWLASLAGTLFPHVGVTRCDTLRDIIDQPYRLYDYVFLTPNYLAIRDHSILSYVLKHVIVRYKSSNATILAYDIWDIIGNALRPEVGFFNAHMFDNSLGLLKNHLSIFNDISEDEILRLAYSHSGCDTTKPVISEIFIFPFSGSRNKDYGLDNFLSLGKALEGVVPQTPIRFFVNARDQKRIDASVRECFRFESRSLLELVEVFSRDILVISNDSGPAHLAAYYDANTITLFGPTLAERYRPIGSGCHVSIASQSKIVQDITVDQILHAAKNSYRFNKKLVP